MYSVVYFFLRQFFRWGGNFKRQICVENSVDNLATMKDLIDKREDVKKKLMQDSDQFFKMIFQMKSSDNEPAQASDNQEELE